VLVTGGMLFGQLWLTPSEVCVVGDTGNTTALAHPTAIRAWVREKPFRPLPTKRDLSGGWHVEIRQPEWLHAVVETVYPGAVADWAAHRRKQFQVAGLAEVAGRQTGMLRELATLGEAQKAKLAKAVCGQCVRHPTWFHGDSLR